MTSKRPSGSTAKSPPAAISGTSKASSARPSYDVRAMRLPAKTANIANPFGIARVRGRVTADGPAKSMDALRCLPESANSVSRRAPEGAPHDTSRWLPFAAMDGAARPGVAPSSVFDADATPAVLTVAISMRSPGTTPAPGATVSRHVTKKLFPLQATAGAVWTDALIVSACIRPEAMTFPSLLMSAKRLTPRDDCQTASQSLPSKATDGVRPAASGKVAITNLVASSTIVIRTFGDAAGPSSQSSIVRPRPAAISGDA